MLHADAPFIYAALMLDVITNAACPCLTIYMHKSQVSPTDLPIHSCFSPFTAYTYMHCSRLLMLRKICIGTYLLLPIAHPYMWSIDYVLLVVMYSFSLLYHECVIHTLWWLLPHAWSVSYVGYNGFHAHLHSHHVGVGSFGGFPLIDSRMTQVLHIWLK